MSDILPQSHGGRKRLAIVELFSYIYNDTPLVQNVDAGTDTAVDEGKEGLDGVQLWHGR